MLPDGLDAVYTTFGKKTEYHGTLYDIVMPKVPMVDKTPRMKEAGVQLDRVYCTPAFNPDLTYGHRTFTDKRGTYARCCLTDDSIVVGNASKTIMNSIQSDFIEKNQSRVGKVLAPNDNIRNVPEGYSFGMLKPPDNLPQCLTYCDLNPDRKLYLNCLKHLNTLRKVLSKRFLPNFFNQFYLNIKYFDSERRGWLPKDFIYDMCAKRLIRFDPSLIEPLLSMWQAFDGANIEYKTFVHVINYREPSPELPKVKDLPDECLDFRTTYKEMVKPGQEGDKRKLAGVPSGRYFDLDYPITPEKCCRAARTCLPQESDMKSCLNPSVLTLYHVSHRDMYAKREPGLVRKVFEAAGDKLSDEEFNNIWEDAKKHHSEGWVSFETFRRSLESYNMNKNDDKNAKHQ
ncbi:EF-hand domain-containing family member B-like [Leptidea sinapis]|uniref:EF-hand domain-containing family member B-like n=1 Tax=Leptidea sinapis TaxID=189913 RepID=UPI00212E5C9F|nr:EF-hand domain-containing family member B-like [Leptidea sinapis]